MIKKPLTKALFILMALGTLCIAQAGGLGVLSPKGIVAYQERKLMLDTLVLMLIVVLPVIIMSFAFAYRYKASKRLGGYRPEWSHNTLLEIFWWGIPTVIVLILGIIVWKKTHDLDPYRPLDVKAEKELVQVVALRWKWLFIYPKEGIATINDLYMPINKEIEFHITADAPMSAFDIPQLGGQIYAMAGMRTKLHLYSSHEGTYDGLNTQLNGDGFSEMHFPAHVVSQKTFDSWVRRVKTKKKHLSTKTYAKLYDPEIAAPPVYYSTVTKGLFGKVMKQYMQANSWLHRNGK